MRATSTIIAACLAFRIAIAAEPDFPLTEDSKPQPGVAKGEMMKGNYTAKEGSVFPGTEREYQIYLPNGLDKTKPAAFMVFQDGVIYQTPVVFDNLIAKKDIPPLIGIFIKPGVVPAANDSALPRFNRSFEYDSVTDAYASFLIDEFFPAIEKAHGIKLSVDPNQAAIAGNSSGGICAFMVAWHRHDRFRRVFTGVGTYVGIHGADQLPVLVRKFEPKPIRVFLQSGTNDNNLYCGDWWMANQMMERSLAWAGYDVNHAWGEGGHNQKHASQVFPDALRWLWRDWQKDIEVKANPKGESKWKGYEVVEEQGWKVVARDEKGFPGFSAMTSKADGIVFVANGGQVHSIDPEGKMVLFADKVIPLLLDGPFVTSLAVDRSGNLLVGARDYMGPGGIFQTIDSNGKLLAKTERQVVGLAVRYDGSLFISGDMDIRKLTNSNAAKPTEKADPSEPTKAPFPSANRSTPTKDPFAPTDRSHPTEESVQQPRSKSQEQIIPLERLGSAICLSPDQTQLFLTEEPFIRAYQIGTDGGLGLSQLYFQLDGVPSFTHRDGCSGMCVDTDGRLYVATSLGIQVCDQAGRVNFIIPTPKQPYDVCFGGKDLSELFIACGDTIYKRSTKVYGIVSGQQPPVKPAPPKL